MQSLPETQSKNFESAAIPGCPILITTPSKACFLSQEDGALETVPLTQASRLVMGPDIIVLHAGYVSEKLNLRHRPRFDLLELFAFLCPGQAITPTVSGLAIACGLSPSDDPEDQAMLVIEIMDSLFSRLSQEKKDQFLPLLNFMNGQNNGWAWAPYLIRSMGAHPTGYSLSDITDWKERLSVWEDTPPPPPPAHHAVSEDEAETHLNQWLSERSSNGDHNSEDRPQQKHYTKQLTKAFQPIGSDGLPRIVLAEAGTGIGKTLGYLNPAWLWAEKNKDRIWLSTYTKNLQRQLEQELDGLIPTQEDGQDTVVIRKGRENYLCLLNLEDSLRTAHTAVQTQKRTASGIMLRWMLATDDGDFTGQSFPGWLISILSPAETIGLADRRGECIYAACDHYKNCLIEKARRKSENARLVISNHALTMIQAAIASPGTQLPSRYIFDEGHHLFDAADSAFAANLTALEVMELKRWVLGSESGRKTRARGLRKRLEGLFEDDSIMEKALSETIRGAHRLPGYDMLSILRSQKAPAQGITQLQAGERFFLAVKSQVQNRINQKEGSYGLYALEAECYPLQDDVIDTAKDFEDILRELRRPLKTICDRLLDKYRDEDGQEEPDKALMARYDAMINTIERRSDMMLTGWITMLAQLQEGKRAESFIDWFGIDRIEGQDHDIGYYRRWPDPMQPFAAALGSHAQAMAVTSATLRDTQDEASGWDTAMEQTGAQHFNAHLHSFHTPSPFDYANQSRIFIVNDVRKDNPLSVAKAYAKLMLASGGGALGIFTAIQRLRQFYPTIRDMLAEADIPLYAQHVDPMDTGTLIDLFRAQENSCLLGTDAVRDGVDVPGGSLRLLLFERVPWPRPTILHKARREQFGGRSYDERMTRLKLKQAYGRLIRRRDDKGVFVMMDPMLPTRLLDAFPQGVEIVKAPLEEVIASTKDFLK